MDAFGEFLEFVAKLTFDLYFTAALNSSPRLCSTTGMCSLAQSLESIKLI